MNARLTGARSTTRGSLALSLVAHVFLIIGIASITFFFAPSRIRMYIFFAVVCELR